MLAMAYLGPSRVKAVKKPEPRLEHPNDVLLRVTRAAICGSDVHLYHGLIPDTRVGSTFGHEFVGVVEELGPSVETLARGDRPRPSGPASSATATPPAVTTAGRRNSCACRSRTSGR